MLIDLRVSQAQSGEGRTLTASAPDQGPVSIGSEASRAHSFSDPS